VSELTEFLELVKLLEKNGGIKVSLSAQVDIGIVVSGGGGGGQLVIDASGVPNKAQVGVAYNGLLKVTGGQAPYNFSIASGSLPDGLTLNADGSITGVPGTAAAFDAIVNVVDSSPLSPLRASQRVSNRVS
jgi:Putative Ig domain